MDNSDNNKKLLWLKKEGYWFGAKSLNSHEIDEGIKTIFQNDDSEQKATNFIYVKRPAINLDKLPESGAIEDLNKWKWWEESCEFCALNDYSGVPRGSLEGLNDFPLLAAARCFCTFYGGGLFPPEWVLHEINELLLKWLKSYNAESPQLLDNFLGLHNSTNRIALSKKIRNQNWFDSACEDIEFLNRVAGISINDIVGMNKNGIDLQPTIKLILGTTPEGLAKKHKEWIKRPFQNDDKKEWLLVGGFINPFLDRDNNEQCQISNREAYREYYSSLSDKQKDERIRHRILSIQSYNNEILRAFLKKYNRFQRYLNDITD